MGKSESFKNISIILIIVTLLVAQTLICDNDDERMQEFLCYSRSLNNFSGLLGIYASPLLFARSENLCFSSARQIILYLERQEKSPPK